MPVKNLVNAKEAAEIIGCTDGRVRQLLREGTLVGIKATERAWLIRRKDAEKYRDTEQATGRPRKSAIIS